MVKLLIILVLLMVLELIYFKIADKFNIIDKPNRRSSHSTTVLRGGGIVFLLGAWLYAVFYGLTYPWFLLGLTLIAAISFVDDVISVPNKWRLLLQFVSMGLMLYEIFSTVTLTLTWWMWALVGLIAIVIFVGAINIINFMDGINGITAGYSLAVLVPLVLVNDGNIMERAGFIDQKLLLVVIASLFVFSYFNFRDCGKAKCFAGDVGSIGVAYILLFMIGSLVLATQDVTWLILLLVYGVDGVMTICHRILLHENLGKAHRKHVYQLMANELKIGHVKVASFYALLQLAISLGFISLCPSTVAAHWIYLVCSIVVLAVAYVLFKRKYYHLHEEYLASLAK